MKCLSRIKALLRCPRWLGTHIWHPYGGGTERCSYCGAIRQA